MKAVDDLPDVTKKIVAGLAINKSTVYLERNKIYIGVETQIISGRGKVEVNALIKFPRRVNADNFFGNQRKFIAVTYKKFCAEHIKLLR